MISLVLMPPGARAAYLPSNLCLRKSKRAFCIMSVTWGGGGEEGGLGLRHGTDQASSWREAASLGTALRPAPSAPRTPVGGHPLPLPLPQLEATL